MFILVAIDNWNRTILDEFVGHLLDKKKPIDWAVSVTTRINVVHIGFIFTLNKQKHDMYF